MPQNRTTARGSVPAPLSVPSDLAPDGIREIADALKRLLADTFALYVKTKNFHWHMSGPHYRDYHLLLDEHGDQLFAMTDPIAERARKLGALTIHSIGEIHSLQRLTDDDREFVDPAAMLAELRDNNLDLTRYLRATHEVCERHGDVATASLLETWIDETERRTWFLAEIVGPSGR
jgi:starvation-inducible DNA-binding protein